MSAPPIIALLGAPGTGAAALALDLQQHIALDAARIIVCAAVPDARPEASLTLLMGLDLPCILAELHLREAADARLRTALADAGTAYRVVYGQGHRRTENALNAIKNAASSAYPSSARGHFDQKSSRLRAWNCEKCSDPECERRLFKRLLS